MNQIEGKVTSGVAKVAAVIDGDTAHIHRYLAGYHSREIYFLSSTGVVQA